MSLLDTLRKHLTDEQLSVVQDALGDDFDYDVVPRSRLNKVIKQRNEARKMVSQLQAGEDLEDDDDDFDDPGKGAGSEGAGKKAKSPKGVITQKALEEALNQMKTSHAQEMKDLQIQYAALRVLQEAQFVDPQLVWDSKLIDKSKLDFDEKGQLTGLSEQLDPLKTNKPYLINAGGARRGTGKQGGEEGGAGGTVTKEDFMKMSYEEQLAFKQNNPEVFKTFLA